MTLLSSLNSTFADAEEYIQHGAAWLLGASKIAQSDIALAEASDPLVYALGDLARLADRRRGKGRPGYPRSRASSRYRCEQGYRR